MGIPNGKITMKKVTILIVSFFALVAITNFVLGFITSGFSYQRDGDAASLFLLVDLIVASALTSVIYSFIDDER